MVRSARVPVPSKGLLRVHSRTHREVEGRRPIVCMLSVSAVALLVAVGLYSHYCPCWVSPSAQRLHAAHHPRPHPRPRPRPRPPSKGKTSFLPPTLTLTVRWRRPPCSHKCFPPTNDRRTTTQPLAHHRAPCTLAQGPAAKRRSKDGEDRRTAEEPAAVLGFYSDPKHARPGSLAGARLTLNSSPNPITLNSSPNPITNPHTNPNPALSQTPTLTSIRQPEI